jgi:hypothetical protein
LLARMARTGKSGPLARTARPVSMGRLGQLARTARTARLGQTGRLGQLARTARPGPTGSQVTMRTCCALCAAGRRHRLREREPMGFGVHDRMYGPWMVVVPSLERARQALNSAPNHHGRGRTGFIFCRCGRARWQGRQGRGRREAWPRGQGWYGCHCAAVVACALALLLLWV